MLLKPSHIHPLVALSILAAGAQCAHAATVNLKYVDLRRDAISTSSQAVAPQAVNDLGVSVGILTKSVKVFDRSQFKFVTYDVQTPVKWSATGTITALKLPSGAISTGAALAINSAGVAAGHANGVPAVWSSSGALTALDTRTGAAYAINAAGDVAGEANLVVTPPMPTPQDLRRAVVWRKGVAQELHSLIPRAIGSRAVAINAKGSVAVEMVAPFMAYPLGCYLVQNGATQAQALAFSDDVNCTVVGMADDDSVLTLHQAPRTCDPSNPGVCVAGRSRLALWRQGVAIEFDAPAHADLTADGTIWMQNGNAITRWRNGVSEPITLNITGLPAGTTTREIGAITSKGYMLWDGDVVGGQAVTQRHGLLTPVP